MYLQASYFLYLFYFCTIKRRVGAQSYNYAQLCNDLVYGFLLNASKITGLLRSQFTPCPYSLRVLPYPYCSLAGEAFVIN